MFQRKKKVKRKNPEKMVNEIDNLPDKEFKVLITKILTGLGEKNR